MADAVQSKKEIIMNNILKKIAWLFILAPAIYLAMVWNRLPEKLAIQYDLSGEPIRFGNRNELMIMMIVITILSVLLYLFLPLAYKIDPKKTAVENKGRLYRMTFAITVFIAAVQCLIIYSGMANSMSISLNLVFAGVGLLLAIIGNYLPNLKPNYFAGLRLPWTLENPDNWRKTHLLAGKLWFAGGLVLAVLCLFVPAPASLIVFFVVMCILIIIPCVFSYRLYKKQKALS
jgi:uncharacterized membrane protein